MEGRAYYENDNLELEVNGVTYSIYVTAEASCSYYSGRMYMRNGDPGYPAEEEFELEEVEFTASYLEDETEVTDKEVLKAISDELDEWLNDNSDKFDYVYDNDTWTDPEKD